MNRRQWKVLALILAASTAGGMFVGGCAGKDARQQAVATVNGEEIKGGELRESLGVPAGVFAVAEIPVEKKKEALEPLVAVRLMAQDARSRGLDNTARFKEIVLQNDPVVRIRALVRKEFEGKLKVTEKEFKAEIAKVKKLSKGISDADAAVRAVKSVSADRMQKIQEDLIAVAKKETAAAVDAEAVARIGKEENLPDDVVLASVGDEKILYGDVKKIFRGGSPPAGAPHGRSDTSINPALAGKILEREVTMRALAAYAKKQGVEGSGGYMEVRQEMERSVLQGMVADDIVGQSIEVTDKEVAASYDARMKGVKVPADIAAEFKDQIRAALRKEKEKKEVDAYIAGLRQKAKITVNDDILSRI